jgi:hypothetical protein
MPVIPAHGRLRREDPGFNVSLDYIVRPCVKKKTKNQNQTARHWWFMPVILSTQEAEIRRTKVKSQPWANSL